MKKELKIGILAVVVLAAAFLVINFLRGKDLMNREYELVSSYEDVQGLMPSSAVYIKGYKAGTVADVTYDKSRGCFFVKCSVSKDFAVPEDSRMTIYSADLMGGKAIRIDLGTSDVMVSDGDTLTPSTSPDMLSSLASGVEPLISKGYEVMDNLDNALTNMNLALSEENRASIENILRNLDETVYNVRKVTSSIGGRTEEIEDFITGLDSLSVRLCDLAEKAGTSMSDINSITSGLSSADIEGMVADLDSLLEKLHGTEGTAGKLINDKSVYESLDSLLVGLDRLLTKIEENPKKYLKISVF